MTDRELARRKERAENEPLILSRTEQGYRVYAPSNPGKFHLVEGTPDAPTCSCADYQFNKADPEWRCKHILAALAQLEKTKTQPAAASPKEDRYEQEERQAIQQEVKRPEERKSERGLGDATLMRIKRSVSPDGKIDSLSVDFTCSVDDAWDEEVRARAKNVLDLQSAIVEGFLGNNSKDNRNGARKVQEAAPDGSVPAQMLTVGDMPGKWGRRLFINIEVNGKTLKLFGNRKQLAEDIVAAGFPDLGDRIAEGFVLNLPCRVITKPSEDGKYVNVERVLPIEALRFTRKPAQ